MRTASRILVLSSCVAVAALIGCESSERPTYRVSGKVQWKGQPVPKGLIYFEPDLHRSNDGPQGFAMIENGQYDTGQGGRNVVAGPHVVRVEGYDGKEGHELPLGRLIFSEYSFEHDLPGEYSNLDIDVPATHSAKTRPTVTVP